MTDSTLTFVPIGVVSLKEVSTNLRRLADDMDSGTYEAATTAVVVLAYPDGDMTFNGYGERTSPLEIIGWLARAQAKLLSFSDPARRAAPSKV